MSEFGKILTGVIGLEEVALGVMLRAAATRTAMVLIAGAITGGALATGPALAILAGVSLAIINIDDLYFNDIGKPEIVFSPTKYDPPLYQTDSHLPMNVILVRAV